MIRRCRKRQEGPRKYLVPDPRRKSLRSPNETALLPATPHARESRQSEKAEQQRQSLLRLPFEKKFDRRSGDPVCASQCVSAPERGAVLLRELLQCRAASER